MLYRIKIKEVLVCLSYFMLLSCYTDKNKLNPRAQYNKHLGDTKGKKPPGGGGSGGFNKQPNSIPSSHDSYISTQSDFDLHYEEPLKTHVNELLKTCKSKGKATAVQLQVRNFLISFCSNASNATEVLDTTINSDNPCAIDVVAFLFSSLKVAKVEWGSTKAPLYQAIRNCLEASTEVARNQSFDIACFLFEKDARIPATHASSSYQLNFVVDQKLCWVFYSPNRHQIHYH